MITMTPPASDLARLIADATAPDGVVRDALMDAGIDLSPDLSLSAFRFFHARAGWSHDPARETPDAGRARNAVSLALAEAWGRDQCDIVWEDDAEHGSPYEGCIVTHPDGRSASLWGIADADRGDYRRVVAAELCADVRAQGEPAAIVFDFDGPHGALVVERTPSDYPDFHRAFDREGAPPARRAVGVDVWDFSGPARYYAVWVDDCFDPPIAVVRAKDEGEAEEMFLDALDWSHITAPLDLADYDADALHYTSSGIPCDTEGVRIREVSLARIERATKGAAQ